MNYRSFVYVSLSKLGDQQSGLHSDIRVKVMFMLGFLKKYTAVHGQLRYI